MRGTLSTMERRAAPTLVVLLCKCTWAWLVTLCLEQYSIIIIRNSLSSSSGVPVLEEVLNGCLVELGLGAHLRVNVFYAPGLLRQSPSWLLLSSFVVT